MSTIFRFSPCRRDSMTFSWGDYYGVCQSLALVSCPLLGGDLGIVPKCYSRNIDINDTIIFQPGTSRHSPNALTTATCIIHMAAIIMTAIMLWHVNSKYSAVGTWNVDNLINSHRSQRALVLFVVLRLI